MKICSSCRKEKRKEDFGKNSHAKDGLQNQCKSCRHKYTEKNSIKLSEKCRIWRIANREKAREFERNWVKKNKDKVREYQRKWRELNKDSEKKRVLAWRYENIERYKENCSRWKRENKGSVKISDHKRRARKIGNGGVITKQEWVDLCNKYENKCLCCGRGDVDLTIDHIVPISVGGRNVIENAQPLCRSCNCKKHTKTIDYRVKIQNEY